MHQTHRLPVHFAGSLLLFAERGIRQPHQEEEYNPIDWQEQMLFRELSRLPWMWFLSRLVAGQNLRSTTSP